MDKVKTIHMPMCQIDDLGIFPSYAKEGDAGMDLSSRADVLILPGQTMLVPTGIKMALPKGYEAQIRPRSGLSLNTMLRLPNSPGTIDAGYRDEICVVVHNASCLCQPYDPSRPYLLDEKKNRHGAYLVKAGDRIAQMVISEVVVASFEPVSQLPDDGRDRKGGFGSTGR